MQDIVQMSVQKTLELKNAGIGDGDRFGGLGRCVTERIPSRELI